MFYYTPIRAVFFFLHQQFALQNSQDYLHTSDFFFFFNESPNLRTSELQKYGSHLMSVVCWGFFCFFVGVIAKDTLENGCLELSGMGNFASSPASIQVSEFAKKGNIF